MTDQGGCTDKVKLSELKVKMSSAVRNLRPAAEALEDAFKGVPSQVPDAQNVWAERYFMMKQKASETPLERLHRLNKVAVKADIKYRSSEIRHAQHAKRFMKSMKGKPLKSILINPKFDDVDDLEYVLQKEEVLALDGSIITTDQNPRLTS
jgi:hypothetical protein